MSIKTNQESDYTLATQDSLLIKGLAICFMLWHHLFYEHPEYGELVQYTAILGKVCVAMFLFVSAYGLTVQVEKKDSFTNINQITWKELLDFYSKRFSKLYANFWVVFIIFVPLGVFVFNRSLATSYGGNNIISSLLSDFLGFGGSESYNNTWWFYQLIIVLYLLYPLFYLTIKKWNVIILVLFFLISGYHRFRIPIVHDWLFSFAIGVSCALNKNSINQFLNLFNKQLSLILAIVFIIVIAYVRGHLKRFGNIGMDGFFTLAWLLFILFTVRKIKILHSIFAFLGNHSMNIFLIHMFICYYFFSEFIYSFKYPILIFVVLLIISLSISVILEFTKTKIGLYSLLNKIICQIL